MNPNIIYGLIDPRTLMVRYVGQSTKGTARARRHNCNSVIDADKTTHKARWIRQLKNEGLQYGIVVLQETTPAELDDAERWWIVFGRACDWPLTNLDGGGRDRRSYPSETRQKMSVSRRKRVMKPLSQETKDKISAANKGKVRTPEVIAKLSAIKKGLAPSNKGVANAFKHTEEAKAKIAAAGRGRKLPPHVVEALRQRNRGRVVSLETREKMRIARIGFKHTAESRAKTAASNRGKIRSEETKSRMREAWVRRRARTQLSFGGV